MAQVKQNATFDSSFWINAHRSGLLETVMQEFNLHFCDKVAEELSERFPSGREFWRLARVGALKRANPRKEVVRSFGPGERAAMNLALEQRDWVLLIDDKRPLQEAQNLGLNALCTPVLTASLAAMGQIDLERAIEILARLSSLGTVSPTLIEAAVAQLAAQSPRVGRGK